MPRKTSLIFESAGETYTAQGIEGEGATSVVFRVCDSDGRVWALKRLKPEEARSDRIKRFLNELHFCRNSNHKNVISVADNGFVTQDQKKCPFYVMPLYGSNLRKLMTAGIQADKVLHLFGEMLSGVEAAHLRDVIHRDLKPENVLHDPVAGQTVVSDFGIAHFNSEFILTLVETKPHERLANIQYAAPEQLRRGAVVDKRADIYALGLMLNEMFTGHVPRGAGFARIASVASSFGYLDELVETMIQHDPDKRPSTIDEVKRALIARTNDFIERQKLDKLRKTVVPVSTVSHPLLENPPRVVDFDIDPNASTLTMFLDRPVSREWIEAFNIPRSMGYIRGTGPNSWAFSLDGLDDGRSRATVKLHPMDLQQHLSTQQIMDKSYVEFANKAFRENLERQARAKEAQARKAQQEEVAHEEERQRLRSRLKI